MNKTKEEVLPPQTLRILDANFNRLREGIRVVEDICRYYKNSKELSSQLKELRHKSRVENYKKLLTCRDITNDPLKQTTNSEKTRESLEAVILSNIKRAQESARVLEEIFKLFDTQNAEKFKQIRYDLYKLEQDILI
ncbi:thiamine-phosphate pyrophosphorylase [Sulfurospirillum arcachonense]|uniref:thiamine-phosphate pyrophosphorylase n=1 Tax=Sulfurospirillum arcachonense TaxID=57666 RepID=UPI001576E7F5|nr:thiamine-phosphate pyrophosphorylase [Sulfurospirillum arcachonense]